MAYKKWGSYARAGKRLARYAGPIVGSLYGAYKRYKGGNGRSGRSTRTRQRTSYSRSRTMTKTRNKTKFVGASSSGNSHSAFFAKGRTSRVSGKIWKTMTPPSCYMIDNNWRVEANNGEQAAIYVPHLDYVNLGTLMTNAGLIVNENGKIYLDKYQSEMFVTNQDSGNCRMTFYDIVCRRDTTVTDPIAVWDKGLKENIGSTTNTRAVANLNSSPFQSAEFCSQWKVLKKTVVQMSAGQSHIHKVNIKYGTLVPRDLVDNYVYFHGLSFVTIVVVHGMPYNEQLTQTDVATGDCALSIVRTQKLYYRMVINNQSYYGYSKNQAALADEYVMNAKSGTAMVDQEA